MRSFHFSINWFFEFRILVGGNEWNAQLIPAFSLFNFKGKPQIKMTKRTSPDGLYKTVACHVEGFPKPAVQWTSTGGVINKASNFLIISVHINFKSSESNFQKNI